MRMDPFLKMNVFFVVTTIVVLLVGALIVVILVYVARLVRALSQIATDVEEEAQEIRADLGEARAKVKKEGLKLSQLLSFFGLRRSSAPRKPRKKT